MKKNLNVQLLIVIFFMVMSTLMVGCKDVFEEDISKKKLWINTPAEGVQSSIYKQLFWWNELEGATQYTVQVVSPSFDSLVNVWVDTTLVGVDRFYKTLDPGKYQWRIRAENGYYKTEFQTISFVMGTSPLNEQTITLVSPANNKFYGIGTSSNITFSWDKLYGATKYKLQIDSADGDFSSGLALDTTITDFSYFYKLKEGEYIWRVKAMDNSGIETPWSSVYTTGYFGTKPTTPELSFPKNDTLTENTSIKLSWKKVETATTYRVSIYKNPSNLTTDLALESTTTFTVDASTLYKVLSLTGYTLDDKIYWRVVAIDKAGNKSDLSEYRFFQIN